MSGFSKRANKGNQTTTTQREDYTPQLRPLPKIVNKVFTPTKEQGYAEELFMSKEYGIVKIGAAAGSGKSSTLFYLGKQDTRPSLGLVFGKDMAEDARAKSPSHIDWRSTHSLAYGKFGAKYQHKLKRPHGRYVNVAGTGAEIGRYLGLKPTMPFFGGHINVAYLGLIIKETVGKFETSADEELSRKHLPYNHIKDLEKKNGRMFNKDKFKVFIRDAAKELWELRKSLSSNVLITHNTYLKLYHLSNPDLSLEYSVIYLDEAQDLNPVTLDIIMKQQGRCKIILVGDSYQNIYSFNGAVNGMKEISCPEASLTKSFRFGQPIADLASAILDYKLKIVGNENIESMVSDKNVIDESKPYTILFRGNMELIFTAVQYISEGKDVQVYVDLREFVKTITSAKELKAGNLKGVKAEKIIPFENWEELVEEGKTDPELSRLAKIIDGEDADRIVKQLKDHKNDNHAHITMLSAHKSKGLEWEQVILANDFVSNYDKKGRWVGLSEQERNLLYVAATRAERRLQYNATVGEILDHHNIQRELDNVSEFDEELSVKSKGLQATVTSVKSLQEDGRFIEESGCALFDSVQLDSDQEYLRDMNRLGSCDSLDKKGIDSELIQTLDILEKWS